MKKTSIWLRLISLILLGTVLGTVLTAIFIAALDHADDQAEETVSYASFREHVTDGDVLSVRFEDERLVGLMVDPDAPLIVAVFQQMEGDDLIGLLDEYGTDYEHVIKTDYVEVLMGIMGFILIPVVLFAAFFRSSFTSSKKDTPPEMIAETPSVTLADVAGAEEAKEEIRDIVAYLRSPGTFSRVGARPPRGVLLHGPPGTGKTLLARATAGEAGVPFFQVAGSDFVEKWVGTGAARVRELFKQARANAPCIVFIDEVDAAGMRRPDRPENGDREHAQTLNALLACIDGFSNDPKAPPVVLIAATNRPEMLDAAFVRPGRFDRQVVVALPGPAARRQMFAVHVKSVVLSPSVDIDHLAELASGMSGAGIANIVNEAARAATRRGADAIEVADFLEAFDTVQIGGKATDRISSPDERRRTAVHESAHAILARIGRIPVRRVTILPRGHALGANILGGQDTPPTMPDEVRARVAMLLAGHAGEELVFGKPSLGSSQDIEEANRLLSILYSAGHSKVYPLVVLNDQGSRAWSDLLGERSKELLKLLAYARLALERHRALLDELTDLLLCKETLLREELDERLASVPQQTPSS